MRTEESKKVLSAIDIRNGLDVVRGDVNCAHIDSDAGKVARDSAAHHDDTSSGNVLNMASYCGRSKR
jgi:hypothetical protein